MVDALLVHEGKIEDDMLARYRAEGAQPLSAPDRLPEGVRLFSRPLADDRPKLRHASLETAEGLLAAWRAVRMEQTVAAPLGAERTR
jgi:hypothetical protein